MRASAISQPSLRRTNCATLCVFLLQYRITNAQLIVVGLPGRSFGKGSLHTTSEIFLMRSEWIKITLLGSSFAALSEMAWTTAASRFRMAANSC